MNLISASSCHFCDSGFSSFPIELWQFIFSKIGFIRLLRTSTVCVAWKNIIPKSVISLHIGEIDFYWNRFNKIFFQSPKLQLNINWQDFNNIKTLEFDSEYSTAGPREPKEIYNENFLRLFPKLQFLSLTNANYFTDKQLIGLTNLKYLYLNETSLITDKSIQTLTNLETLIFGCHDSDKFTDECIRGLTKLTTLSLPFRNTTITVNPLTRLHSLYLDIRKIPQNFLKELTNLTCLSIDSDFEDGVIYELSLLTNLTSLNIIVFDTINDEHIRNLTNLTSLVFDQLSNCNISFEGIKALTKLKKLSLSFDESNTSFDIKDIKKLTYLTDLSIYYCHFSSRAFKKTKGTFESKDIDNDIIRGLTNLTKLSITGRYGDLSYDGLKDLTKLISFKVKLFKDTGITEKLIKFNDNDLKMLTNLTRLSVGGETDFTDEGIKDLTSLTTLKIRGLTKISDKGIENLTNLTWLRMDRYSTSRLKDNQFITTEGIKKLKKLTYFYSSYFSLYVSGFPIVFINTSLLKNQTLRSR